MTGQSLPPRLAGGFLEDPERRGAGRALGAGRLAGAGRALGAGRRAGAGRALGAGRLAGAGRALGAEPLEAAGRALGAGRRAGVLPAAGRSEVVGRVAAVVRRVGVFRAAGAGRLPARVRTLGAGAPGCARAPGEVARRVLGLGALEPVVAGFVSPRGRARRVFGLSPGRLLPPRSATSPRECLGAARDAGLRGPSPFACALGSSL